MRGSGAVLPALLTTALTLGGQARELATEVTGRGCLCHAGLHYLPGPGSLFTALAADLGTHILPFVCLLGFTRQ